MIENIKTYINANLSWFVGGGIFLIGFTLGAVVI